MQEKKTSIFTPQKSLKGGKRIRLPEICPHKSPIRQTRVTRLKVLGGTTSHVLDLYMSLRSDHRCLPLSCTLSKILPEEGGWGIENFCTNRHMDTQDITHKRLEASLISSLSARINKNRKDLCKIYFANASQDTSLFEQLHAEEYCSGQFELPLNAPAFGVEITPNLKSFCENKRKKEGFM